MSLQETTVTEPETEINASIIKWENDNKKKKPELESIIKSERYTIKGLLGRGCWGRVFEGYDKLLEQEVAIKILDPLNATVEQMIYRNLDEFNAMRKEGGKLTACANIVPRRFEVDAHGKPFIVMPKKK